MLYAPNGHPLQVRSNHCYVGLQTQAPTINRVSSPVTGARHHTSDVGGRQEGITRAACLHLLRSRLLFLHQPIRETVHGRMQC